MAIRSEGKAILLHQGKILLNVCEGGYGALEYFLPGGGQNPYETLQEAVRREVAEETGYAVRVDRFLALTEEITQDEKVRERLPNYTHRVLHIFQASLLEDEPRGEASEWDEGQIDCIWVPLEAVESLPVRPLGIAPHIRAMLESGAPLLLPAFYC